MWDGCDVPYGVRTAVRADDDDDACGDASVAGCAGRCGVWGWLDEGDGVEIIQYGRILKPGFAVQLLDMVHMHCMYCTVLFMYVQHSAVPWKNG